MPIAKIADLLTASFIESIDRFITWLGKVPKLSQPEHHKPSTLAEKPK
jgi:hypothetical protein